MMVNYLVNTFTQWISLDWFVGENLHRKPMGFHHHISWIFLEDPNLNRESRKADVGKKSKKHTIKNRITKKTTRREDSPEKKKNIKEQEQKTTPAFSSVVFFLFVLFSCCWFSGVFFLFALLGSAVFRATTWPTSSNLL